MKFHICERGNYKYSCHYIDKYNITSMNKRQTKTIYNLSEQWSLCYEILRRQKEAVIYTDYSFNYYDKGGIGMLIEISNCQIVYSGFYYSCSECPVDDGQTQAILLASDLIDLFPNLTRVQLFTDSDNALRKLKEEFNFRTNEKGDQILSINKVAAHSFIPGNEMADLLAKKGCLSVHAYIPKILLRRKAKNNYYFYYGQ